MEETVLSVVGLLFAHSGLTPALAEERWQRLGLHHLLLEIAIPEHDELSAEDYAAALDDFEGNLQHTVETIWEVNHATEP